jgi:carboxypeptidase T
MFKPLSLLFASSIAVATLAGSVSAASIAIRLHPETSDQRRLLGARFDHFIRDLATGAMIFEADSDDWRWLETHGFAPQIDSVHTAELLQRDAAMIDSIPGFGCYPTVAETYATIDALVAAHPTLAAKIDIGDSWEKISPGGNDGFDLFVIKITNSAIVADKPRLFAMSAVHARELATAPLNTAFARWLLDNYDSDALATWLVDHNEFHLLLQANPDGRAFVEAGNFNQRKNRHFQGSGSGTQIGVDLNRNYPFGWGAFGGSSGSLTSETYRGTSAGSEPENQAVVAYINGIFPDRRPGAPSTGDLTTPADPDTRGLFLDIHSVANLVIWPWGMTTQGNPVTGNNAALITLGRRLAWFNDYSPEQANSLPADGASDDNAYASLGVPAFTIELGGGSFQATCNSYNNEILPDNLEMLKYAARILHAPYRLPAGPDSRSITITPNPAEIGQTIHITAIADDTRFNNSNGTQATQAIAGADVYVDHLPWQSASTAHPMAAADGNFNSTIENLSIDLPTAGMSAGRHLIYVQARDSGGAGAPTAIFLTLTATGAFGDGFE